MCQPDAVDRQESDTHQPAHTHTYTYTLSWCGARITWAQHFPAHLGNTKVNRKQWAKAGDMPQFPPHTHPDPLPLSPSFLRDGGQSVAKATRALRQSTH